MPKKTSQSNKDVREAIDKLPGLLLNQENSKQNHKQIHGPAHQSKMRFLIIGTGCLAVLIMGMWVLNMKTIISTLQINESEDTLLINNAKQDLDVVFSKLDYYKKSQSTNIDELTNSISEEIDTQQNKDLLEKKLKEQLPAVLGLKIKSKNTSTTNTPEINN